ncbi:MAG: hypothetical protein AMJ90_05605 [candidate division Zixibacteria bacterium SM23_73_2]|nr:MAG: hypothetical protein AMJ90_05605 [candidate division Zixibacteria bacterium SM23_73_2]
MRKSEAITRKGKKKLFLAKVFVRLKEGVLDPQGSTIKRALEDMGYDGIEDIRTGRVFEINFSSEDRNKSKVLIDEVCKKLLANPVIEKYKFEVKQR